jgi:hypothetical protein
VQVKQQVKQKQAQQVQVKQAQIPKNAFIVTHRNRMIAAVAVLVIMAVPKNPSMTGANVARIRFAITGNQAMCKQ